MNDFASRASQFRRAERRTPVETELPDKIFERLRHVGRASLQIEQVLLSYAKDRSYIDTEGLFAACDEAGIMDTSRDVAAVRAFVTFYAERSQQIDVVEAHLEHEFGIDHADPKRTQKIGAALFETEIGSSPKGRVLYLREPLQPTLSMSSDHDVQLMYGVKEAGHRVAGFYMPTPRGEYSYPIPIVGVHEGMDPTTYKGVVAHERQHAINAGVFGVGMLPGSSESAQLKPMSQLADEVVATIRNLGADKFEGNAFATGGIYEKLTHPAIRANVLNELALIARELWQFIDITESSVRTTNDQAAVLAMMAARVDFWQVRELIQRTNHHILDTGMHPSEW